MINISSFAAAVSYSLSFVRFALKGLFYETLKQFDTICAILFVALITHLSIVKQEFLHLSYTFKIYLEWV